MYDEKLLTIVRKEIRKIYNDKPGHWIKSTEAEEAWKEGQSFAVTKMLRILDILDKPEGG